MRIDGLELYLVENAFFKPWRTAYGADPGNSVVIARMVSGEHEGWSEASPLPDTRIDGWDGSSDRKSVV